MPKITLVRSFLGVAGKSSCTENDYVLAQSCMFFSYKETFIPYSEIFYFAALNKLVYLMEWQYCNRKYTFHVRLIKLWTHAFDSTQRTKLFFCCSVRLRKALIKYRGQNFFEYSFRNNIQGVPLRALVPCKYSNILSGTTFMACLYVPWSRAAYKQFSSLVERGKMRCENPQRPLGSYN